MASSADRSRRRARGLAGLLFALSLASAGGGRADLASPGELSKAHTGIEGLKNCTKCHQAGVAELRGKLCLDCHVELKQRIDAGTGYHGQLSARQKDSCQICHKEHRGKQFLIVDWAGDRKLFDHHKAGWPLAGKHRKTDCLKCHEARLLQDEPIKALIAKANRTTFLGLTRRCSVCHADEHRGQFGAGPDCKKCHNDLGFIPAIGFDHAKAGFKLDGKHTQVACEKCHRGESDPAAKGAFPSAMNEVFSRFKPVESGNCTACHKDPHETRFGNDCARCHVTSDWHDQKAGAGAGDATGARAFHQKTAFPLLGAHETVACKFCHGPFPGEKAKFKGLTFARCDACHLDAHVGQLVHSGASPDCATCHGDTTFAGARFDVEEHARARYQLEGSHRAVACSACHVRDEGLKKRVPAAVASAFEKRGRKLLVSQTVFIEKGPTSDCKTCHADAHAGQFDAAMGAKGCTACHSLEGFHPVAFDHQTASRFPLEGKHLGVACARCHASEGALPASRARAKVTADLIRWRPVDTACTACHQDPHAGQFAKAPEGCTTCHSAAGWSTLKFQHAPPFTTYLLEGGHEKAACAACHPQVAAGAPLRRYRGTPVRCEQCHSDVHRGAFKEFSR